MTSGVPGWKWRHWRFVRGKGLVLLTAESMLAVLSVVQVRAGDMPGKPLVL